jgi:2-(1,2-epoxy-1,2-dihydrophenyl)acetyl-CoA isomerase
MERDGPVTTITLNRPDALNAFDRALAERFAAALRTVADDRAVRAVIVTGAGRAFSAGQDIRELAREEADQGPAALGHQLRQRYNPIILRLRELEKPVIAAINGVTTGAGLGIALACELRITVESATLGMSPVGIGLIPAVGMTTLLPAVIGLAKATELTFLGERIDAARALDISLVHRIVPAADLTSESHALAHRLAALPTRTIALTKHGYNRAVLPNLAANLEYEAALQQEAAATADHREGLAALLEKRKPVFHGE